MSLGFRLAVVPALSALCLCSNAARGEAPALAQGPRIGSGVEPIKAVPGRLAIDASAPVKPGQIYRVPGSAAEVQLITESLRQRAANGQGADILPGSLTVIQTAFVESKCPALDGMGMPINVVLLIWGEGAVNPSGIDIVIDGALFMNVPGLTQAAIDAGDQNIIFIGGFAPGPHTFRVEESDTGTSSEQMMDILGVQPFSDVGDVACQEGDSAGDGSCDIINCYSPCGPTPDYYAVLVNLNGNPAAAFNFCNRDVGNCAILIDNPMTPDEEFFLRILVTIGGAPPGDFDFTFIGFSEANPGNPNTLYRGCFVAGPTCTVDCIQDDCRPPFCPWLGQLTYPTAADPTVDVLWLWENAVIPYPGGVNLLADGAVFGTDTGDTDIALLDAPIGPVVLGVQGECAVNPGDLPSVVTEKPIDVLMAPILLNPVLDNLVISVFDPDTTSTTATWTNNAVSSIVFVSQVTDPVNAPAGVLVAIVPSESVGSIQSVIVQGTAADDLISIQHLEYQDGVAYAGLPVLSQGPPMPSDFFIRGICTGQVFGAGQPQISDAIFLFGFLFQGTVQTLSCAVACDIDGTGRLELTDGIRVLLFLFQGGPPPVGWDGNTPTCVVFDETTPGFALGCTTPVPQCMGPGPL